MYYNWTGLLIEPNPKAFQELLAKNRKSYAMESCLSVKEEVTEVSFDVAGNVATGFSNSKIETVLNTTMLLFIINQFCIEWVQISQQNFSR